MQAEEQNSTALHFVKRKRMELIESVGRRHEQISVVIINITITILQIIITASKVVALDVLSNYIG